MQLGRCIKVFRKTSSIGSQVEFAEKVGVSRETIINIELGRENTINALPVPLIRKIWRVLKMHTHESYHDFFRPYFDEYLKLE